MAAGVTGEEFFDGRAVCEIDGFFRAADNLLEAPEEEHLDADGWGGRGHVEIVTRGKQCVPVAQRTMLVLTRTGARTRGKSQEKPQKGLRPESLSYTARLFILQGEARACPDVVAAQSWKLRWTESG
jgi:hypothetical protein